MPPPLGFNLPPRRTHAPHPSLSLARSRPGPPGPPSLSGASATSASSRPSPRTPAAQRDDDAAIPLLPLSAPEVTPVDPAAWAAEYARPSLEGGREGRDPRGPEERGEGRGAQDEGRYDGLGIEEGGYEYEARASGDGRRVQFAPDASVAVFDADAEYDEEGGAKGFERPAREEAVWIVISVLAVGGIGAAAVLATLYDWVL